MAEYRAIAAVAENGIIGNGLRIPWHIPEDFKHFKRTTMGGIVVMGRRTWESLGGRPLPGRENVVISSQMDAPEGATLCRSLDELDAKFASDARPIWICGGANLYARALDRCSQIIVSRVKAAPEGDVFFPDITEKFKLEKILDRYELFDVELWTKK